MGTRSLCAKVGVLIISAALQMSVAGAKVKSASQLLSVTLPMRARSLRPHTRLQFLGLEVAPSPTHPAAMGLPGEGDLLLQELCHLRGPTHAAPRSLPCAGQQGEGATPCPWETQGAVQEEEASTGFVLTPSQRVPRVQQPPVYHPHLSGEGAQLDPITCKTPARASHAPGLP